jgi:nitroimidazol reductase NimA-like FMN-containing flavoprotein (pyridoxamine 5'-phosphate oxidase superfamily)
MLVDGGLELLEEHEAWALLRAGVVGRVGVTIGAMPAIFPVNYAVLDDDAVVFRTAPGSKLSAAASDAVVAFEVDDYDRADRSGWSVLVVGRSEVVHDLDVTRKVRAADLEPYADGTRTSIVRIRPVFVSGRRIVREEPPGGA